jgi:hypothetical protein
LGTAIGVVLSWREQAMSTFAKAEVALVADAGVQNERVAIAGFLAGDCDCTRASYATDLRMFATWCHEGI